MDLKKVHFIANSCESIFADINFLFFILVALIIKL